MALVACIPCKRCHAAPACKVDDPILVEPTAPDPVNHPSHYVRGGIELWDVLEAWDLHRDHYLASAVQYLMRAGKKDPGAYAEDCRKAIRNIERAIKRREGNR
jgi:hypothetical protein